MLALTASHRELKQALERCYGTDVPRVRRILAATDPNGFASLILLNRKWRSVSQRSDLYLHHLTQCPTFVTAPSTLPTYDDESLPTLRRLFAREVKRNLFDAYLRPSETVVKLISTSISSSSCPGGEGLQFSTSPLSHHILAYNSSRMYAIDTRGPAIEVRREFKLLRRPAAACIKDDASLLAVLSTEMQVELYDLTTSPPRRRQTIILDNAPRAIALSPCGSVLAAAYEGGIEVSSLNPGVVPLGKRSVKCDGVDSLTFSFDGTQILGTTSHSAPPSTVVLTAPYYDPGSLLADDDISSMWTTSILFPNSSRDCSHAVLLQDGNEEEACWTFAYDPSFETFRAVRIDDLRNGTTYFTGPIPNENAQAKLLPSTLPGTTYHGDLVSAGFHGKDIWVYGVPNDLDAPPETILTHADRPATGTMLGRWNSEHGSLSRNASSRGRDADSGRSPQWALLSDNTRNTFKTGAKVSEVPGVSTVRWVAKYKDTSLQERLMVTARGVSGPRLATEEEDFDFVDGGRIVLLDFDYGPQNGTNNEISIELGTDSPELLEEEWRDLATEVAIVRRRTVAQQRGGRTPFFRAATEAASSGLEVPVPPLPQEESTHDNNDDDDPLVPRRIGQPPAQDLDNVDDLDDPDVATIEEQEAMESPYAHASPRSAPTLRRAATAAAVNRTLNPRTADGRPIEYRRADGRREHPHESDADNWVPPPPPYQKDDPKDLPAFLSGPAIAAPTSPFPRPTETHPSLREGPVSEHLRGLRRSQYTSARGFYEPQRPALEPRSFSSFEQRPASDSTSRTRSRIDEMPRPMSTPSPYIETVDLYDVSPPESPRPDTEDASVPRQAYAPSRTPSESMSDPMVNAGVENSFSSSHVDPEPTPSPQAAPAQRASSPPGEPISFQEVSQEVSQEAQQSSSQPSNEDNYPSVRRLSNAQTWPAGLGGEGSQTWHNPQVGGPPSHVPDTYHGSSPHLPMPSSSQLANLNKRISQGKPRRLSGSLYAAGAGNENASTWSFPAQESSDNWPLRSNTTGPTLDWNRVEDRPMIISTPRGVTGAFDPPEQQSASNRWSGSGTPIFAPVPRHPRPGQGIASPRPTVERLETIYSMAETSVEQQPPRTQTRSGRRIFGGLRRSPSATPPSTVGGSVNRQPSRAERSAAKNIRDAKKNGWEPRRNKSKKGKKKKKDYDAVSSAGWTDVTAPSVYKEKSSKCLVM